MKTPEKTKNIDGHMVEYKQRGDLFISWWKVTERGDMLQKNLKEVNEMKRRWMYVILTTFFAVFLLYSCLPTTTNNTEVTIVVDRLGVYRNATLILAQDGLSGEWKELTGTNGIYKFNVNNPDGVYSVAAVDDSDSEIQLFHSTLAEEKTVNIAFPPDYDTDFATLTVYVPTDYASAKMSIAFLNYSPLLSFSLNDASATVKIPKGRGDLVIIIRNQDSETLSKIYVKRNFDFLSSQSITIAKNDLKDPAQQITGGTQLVFYNWILGKTIVPFFLNQNTAIPETVMNSEDKYVASYLNGDLIKSYISWSKVTKDVPVTIKDGVKELSSATTTMSATTVENNLPKITFVPYTSPISEYKTRYYSFDISKKVTIGDYTYPSQTHSIFITPGYLAKVENVYKFPNITLTAWKDAYKPVTDYVVQSLGICLSPNTIDEINSLKIGTEVLGLYSKF